MIRYLADRLRPRDGATDESGFTIIEVMVAMMVFALISVGIAYSLTDALVLTSDSRSREVATNLAAQAIDVARTTSDVFDVADVKAGDPGSTQVVNGTTFTVTRSTNWITSSGAAGACGTGAGTLAYKRVNVNVTWNTQAKQTSSVHADTLIAPDSAVNDPTLGTLIVTVQSATGAGSPGVTVTVKPDSPANGATTITTQPDVTDANGCSYALKVTPGNYVVSITRSGGVNSVPTSATSAPSGYLQDVTPSKSVVVAAGADASASFQYDSATTMNMQYAANYTSTSPAATLPTNLTATFENAALVPPITTSASTSVKAFPFLDGYQVVAGAYVPKTSGANSCLSVNPSQWTTPATSDGAVGAASATWQTTVGATAPSTVTVPMGVVTVPISPSQPYITAVSSTTWPSDDPGCNDASTSGAQVYTFPKASVSGSSPTLTIALPYGTWTIYQSNVASGKTSNLVAANSGKNITFRTRGQVNTSTAALVLTYANTITLDPRMVP
ncbi:prepilin-type N-terminal cleavage/methylation domain-containing protein [Curtobacterium sp. MCBD17_019]|uniref:prepilin-type N-terminal cleavage/methylation domain-containing protein n=1 Tax=Curtobacterium sp. MCBD17_019 TaxID=2175669 RepID=UPI000DA73F0C|nr:prepilin-type N-terminal cleavage/methylation domain-containing protein [Curtobacterium sp. MCBD17_019]PZE74096.1 hypothetical protein DEI82_12180 [Curtobacterium sp. MCBD17_019]